MASRPTFELEEAWLIAIEQEAQSRELYQRLAALAEDEAVRSLFAFLAGEEAKHERMLRSEYERVFTPDL
ncbi:MAG: hypothetical protein K6V36_16610 [Anaerolineae bacterium]|nr:hypothetical protein [Anaerolineae bacterium]